MSESLTLNPEEKALVEYLMETQEPVLVVLNEDYHPSAASLTKAMRQMQKENPGLELIEGTYSTYSRFAKSQDTWGFPSVLLFRAGELIETIPGIPQKQHLQSLIDEHL